MSLHKKLFIGLLILFVGFFILSIITGWAFITEGAYKTVCIDNHEFIERTSNSYRVPLVRKLNDDGTPKLCKRDWRGRVEKE